MTISILGCGWYGTALGKALVENGYAVIGSSTATQKLPLLAACGITPFLIDLTQKSTYADSSFFNCDVLWICIPPRARAGLGAEYLQQLSDLFGELSTHNLKHVVLVSSTGVYGDVNARVDELHQPMPDTQAGEIILGAEVLLKSQTNFTTTIIRFGGLFGPGRDAARFFAGKINVPNGDAPVNLIHLSDCIGISLALIDNKAFGHVYNAVSPDHPTRMDFYSAAAKRSGMEIPQFINEKQSWKIVDSVNVPALLRYRYQVGLYDNRDA